MNKIINKLLLTGVRFMPELCLKKPRFTYIDCEPFTKHREKVRRVRETGHLKHLYRNELDKACFSHGAAYSDSKDLTQENYFR